jgi:transposase-like protein
MAKKEAIRMMIQEMYEDKRCCFTSLGKGRYYAEPQKRYAFELIDEYGVRATARILKIPRRTLQRWCRRYGIFVRRCPEWVYEWAERHRRKRAFWQRRGYF